MLSKGAVLHTARLSLRVKRPLSSTEFSTLFGADLALLWQVYASGNPAELDGEARELCDLLRSLFEEAKDGGRPGNRDRSAGGGRRG